MIVWNRALLFGGGRRAATVYGSYYLKKSAGSISVPYTISGVNRAVFYSHHSALSNGSATAATFNGVAGVHVGSISADGDTSGRIDIFMWLQSSLPAAGGTYEVACTRVNGNLYDDNGCIFLSDVSQTTPVHAIVTAQNTQTNVTPMSLPITLTGYAGLTALLSATALSSNAVKNINQTVPAALTLVGQDEATPEVNSLAYLDKVPSDSNTYTYTFGMSGVTGNYTVGTGVIAIIVNAM